MKGQYANITYKDIAKLTVLLTRDAAILFLCMRTLYNGSNNGKIFVSLKLATEWGFTRHQLYKYQKELLVKGFIKRAFRENAYKSQRFVLGGVRDGDKGSPSESFPLPEIPEDRYPAFGVCVRATGTQSAHSADTACARGAD